MIVYICSVRYKVCPTEIEIAHLFRRKSMALKWLEKIHNKYGRKYYEPQPFKSVACYFIDATYYIECKYMK